MSQNIFTEITLNQKKSDIKNSYFKKKNVHLVQVKNFTTPL